MSLKRMISSILNWCTFAYVHSAGLVAKKSNCSQFYKVENKVFTAIKKCLLVAESPFPDMFSLPVEDGDIPEGVTKEKPIILEETDAEAFKTFLILLHGGRYV